MSEKDDLRGQTIVFTGHPKSNEALLEVERLGGKVKVFPLIQTQEITSQDEIVLAKLNTYDWLIFTSQNAVMAFEQKLKRHKVNRDSLKSKVAAVGSKTAEALQKSGFQVLFTPTIFSADVFVQQFPKVTNHLETCLFVKGSLAKATITIGLPQQVDEWTVYETLPDANTAQELLTYVKQHHKLVIAFASPSAVEVFAREIASVTGWDRYRTAAIGHVTADALKTHEALVHVQPETYTWLALVQQIALRKDDLQL